MRIGSIAMASLMLVAVFICFSTTGYAQGSNLGTIRGTVTDAHGAVLPNAAVQVTDQATGLARDLTTNGEGNYEVVALKPGTYKVSVSAAGFKTTSMDAVVSGSDTVRADLKLEVGAQTENVIVVGGEAGVIEKDQPVLSSTLDNRQLNEVPRDSREILEFLYLNPDITQGATDGTFKFIGAQSYGASFSLDGQRTNGGIFGEPTSSQPSLETIGELIVLSKNFSAEYSGIANIRIETKRGGAAYHGSLFYNNKNSALAAWATQDKVDKANFLPTPAISSFPTPYFNLNETGGSLGGPVPFSRKNTFFLLSYERRWDFAPVHVRAGNIPTSLILNGDFTALAAGSRPAVPASVIPLLTPTELANNTVVTNGTQRFLSIPTRLLNPIALGIVNGYYPHASPSAPFSATTGRLTDFAQSFGGLLTRDLATLRVDHDFSDKDKFYAVYNFQARNGNRGLVANPLPAFGLLSQHQTNHTLSLSYTRIFSNSFVNELRGGINYQFLYRRANLKTGEWLSSVGFTSDEINSYGSIVGSSLVDTPGQVAFVFGGFPGIPNGGRNTDRPMDQKLSTFGDTISWTIGNHSIRAGGDIVRNQAVDGFALNRNNPRGTVNYANNLGGFASFLLGLPPASVTFVRDVRPALDVSNWEHGYFVNDDFKVNDRFTLTLGLRYEVHTPFVDKNDLMVNFDPNGTGNGGRKGRFVVPTADVISRIHPFFVAYGVVTADEAGVGRGLIKTDKNNFAPRVGGAWRLTQNSVLRGGFGIFYPTSAAQAMRDAIATNTFNQRITKRNTSGLPGGINPRGITPFSGGTVSVQGIAANAIPFDLQDPRFEQYNVTYENEFMPNTGFRVSYIGGRQHGLIAGFDLNELPPSNTPFGITNEDGDRCDPLEGDCVESPTDEARRPFPSGLGDFLASYGNRGAGRSHALQFELNRRFARGFMFNVSYTLLDQKSSGLDVGDSSLGGALYNQFNPNNDLSRDSFVSRHRLVSYGAYDIPFGRGRSYGRSISKLEDALIGGFQISWNMFAKSGTGFTPFWICDNCSPVFPGNIASGFVDAVGDFSGPSFRPLVNGNPYAGVGPDHFFNAAAFAVPTTGADVFDNPAVAKRNSLLGPGTWGVNMGFKKFFAFNEQTRLEVGVDFNNIFNHPLLSPQDIEFANLGDFSVSLNAAGQPVILPENVNRNPDFGRNNLSFTQEGIDNRRSVRLKLRLTF
ncbi:MAG TPA: carboxypeptidase-like regulatory domain-containing protein [Pyrinomonadaceae bacterium]|nr:carboxypeptidase-like regulatory domain-containing protein [Pyrinomonadaceae bacterium]